MERAANLSPPAAERGAASHTGSPARQAPAPQRDGGMLAQLDSRIHASPRMAAQRRRMDASAGVAQREVENENYDEEDADGAALAKKFFAAYDEKVQQAYAFVVSVPSLGALAKLDGRTQLWARLWADHLAGKQPKLLAAAFGYVVESLVSDPAGFAPSPPGGCSVLPQVVSGGTRPDLVLILKKGGQQIAWLDLTASESADHIFDKDNWGAKIRHYAEVTYPSLTLATLALMKQNKDNLGALSKEEFEARQKAAEAEYLKNKTRWLVLGQEFTVGNQRGELAKVGLGSPGTRSLQPELPREFIRKKLGERFGADIDMKLVPSILTALGVGATPWGFQIGFSQSEKAGEAWLIDNAPPE